MDWTKWCLYLYDKYTDNRFRDYRAKVCKEKVVLFGVFLKGIIVIIMKVFKCYGDLKRSYLVVNCVFFLGNYEYFSLFWFVIS